MDIQKIAIDKLQPAEYNPRKMDAFEMENLKKSISTFGLVEPIVVNKDMTVIGGHQRLRAATELGWTAIDCLVLDLSKDHEKVLNLALNRIVGSWDEGKLMTLIKGISETPDIKLTGFDELEVQQLLVRYQLEFEATPTASGDDEEMKKIFDRHQRVEVPVAPPNAKVKKDEIGFYCDTYEQWKKIKETFETSRMGELDTEKLIGLVDAN